MKIASCGVAKSLMDRKICNDTNLNDEILIEFETLKSELNEIYSTKGKEAMFRSRVKWVKQGEKPTKYFFNLEKRNYEKKIITQLKVQYCAKVMQAIIDEYRDNRDLSAIFKR